MFIEPPTKSAKPITILESNELDVYRGAVSFVERQMAAVQQAQAAVAEAQYVLQALENERIRCWQGLCIAHGLDPQANYAIDPSGRVFEPFVAPARQPEPVEA